MVKEQQTLLVSGNPRGMLKVWKRAIFLRGILHQLNLFFVGTNLGIGDKYDIHLSQQKWVDFNF